MDSPLPFDDPLGASLKGLAHAIELKEAGQLDEAAQLFGKLAAKAPDDPTILINASIVANLREDYSQSIRWLSRATEVAPRNGIAWAQLGVAFHRIGQLELALTALDRAVELAPAHGPAQVERAQVRSLLGL